MILDLIVYNINDYDLVSNVRTKIVYNNFISRLIQSAFQCYDDHIVMNLKIPSLMNLIQRKVISS
jgi:hypothetical protein